MRWSKKVNRPPAKNVCERPGAGTEEDAGGKPGHIKDGNLRLLLQKVYDK
jgi:hypothetical protein